MLESELADPSRGLLPPRLDWEGRRHSQTFSDLESQFPQVTGQHLTAVTSWLRSLTGGSPRSLLCLPGRRSRLNRANKSVLSIISNQSLGLSRSRHRHLSTGPVYSSVYSRLQLQRRCLGHLSSVFCLLFDKTGQFIFTGADDLLVKMWGTHNGRLYFTFRGASAEISDMAVSEDNRLLAAGSTDKIIRVWCLLTAAPVTVLSKHTGTITALHFCPCAVSSVSSYLAATSGDGTVSFWKYQYQDKTKKRAVFDPEPTRYHEKMRPGGAQMICAAFSPGGLFLATGSVDHHVRVYIMEGKEGPGKVLEQEAHTERVDSIQWANSPRLRFVSGSKDGTARIWSFRGGCWNSAVLKVTASDGRTVHFNREKNIEEPLRVTMVNWSCDDRMVITAVSDCSLCVWCPDTSQLLHRLVSHKDEVYVLEPHPIFSNILMSGAHDGNLVIWNIENNSVIFQHHNNINGQGHGAIYDAKWCPDHLNIAASDSHGHVLFFSTNCPEAQGQAYRSPEEMFFHTDYRPLLRDSAHYVLDEQTQCAPHLLPPPFLVDMEGNPYPADIQRLVPGREHLSDKELLVPQENIAGPMSPPVQPRPASASARRSVDSNNVPVSNIDALIEELAATTSSPHISEHSYAVADGAGPSVSQPAPASRQLTGSVWRKRQLIRQELFKSQNLDHSRRKVKGSDEKKFYQTEKQKGCDLSGTGQSPVGFHEGFQVKTVTTVTGRNRGNNRSRGGQARVRSAPTARAPAPARAPAREEEEDSSEDDEEDQDFNEDSVTDSSLTESDLEEPSDNSDNSTEYSDWGDNNLTPPQRTAKKSAKAAVSRPASSDEDDEPKPGPSKKRKKYNFDPRKLEDIPPDYLPSPWLAESIPKKSPYFPQMGDEVMYFKQGHMGYINLVRHRNCYTLNMKEQQWKDRGDLGSVELVKVVGMKYEIRPPRLCCLKLAVIDQNTNQLTGQKFSIKYHDMNDVVDFLVLRHIYDSSMAVTWNVGDRYRCQIEDNWWHGKVIGVSPFEEANPDSPFLSVQCLWDSGEEERLSPWDLDIIPDDGLGQDIADKQIPVTKEEIERHLYQPLPEEWRGLDSKSECLRIARGLEELMALAHAENFNYPVDLTAFPDYMLEIEYPMDFSLIKSRLDNQFYRRLTAVQFDVRYIATNAECYNRPKSEIVRCARVLTDLVLKIIQDPKISNISREWHKLYEKFDWADTQEPSRKVPKKDQKTPPNPKQWKHDCMELLNRMTERPDSEPFREPVNEEEFPDYNRVIVTPMDLSLVRESLRVGEYENPLELQKDVFLIFSNSMQYNTNKKSEVLKMTRSLKEYFQDEFVTVVSNWRKMNRRIGILKSKKKSPKSTPMKKAPPRRTPKKVVIKEESEDDDQEEEDKDSKQTGRRKLSLDSDSEEDKPRYKGKGKGKGKGKSSKAISRPPREEEEDDSEQDVPLSRRRNNPVVGGVRDSRKTGVTTRRSQRFEESDEGSEDEEEVEDTPEETSEEEEAFERSRNKRKRRKSSFFSDPGEGPSRNVRPKRSAKAKVVKEETEEDEEEEKVPYRRISRAQPNISMRRRSEEDRPVRQATRKALSRFQDNSLLSSDEPRSPRKGRRHPQRRRFDSEEDDDDSDEDQEEEERPVPRRRQRPAESEDDPPLQPPAPRSSRPSRSSRGGAVEETGVTISAADSSTDPVRLNRARDSAELQSDISDLGEGGSTSRRPQRKRVKPARLQEYEESNAAGTSRAGRRSERAERFRQGEKRKRSGEERRASRSNRYEEETPDESEEEVLSKRISRSSRNKRQSGGERRKSSNSDYMLSPKAKRAKTVVNYKDGSESGDDSDEEEAPRRRSSRAESKNDKRRGRKSSEYRNESQTEEEEQEEEEEVEEEEEEEEEIRPRRDRRGKKLSGRDQRRKKPVVYEEENSEEETDSDDMAGHYDDPPEEDVGVSRRRRNRSDQLHASLEDYAEEENSEEELGRRRGSRRRRQTQNPRHNLRPQVKLYRVEME